MPKRKSQEKANAAPAAKRVKEERVPHNLKLRIKASVADATKTFSALELLSQEVFIHILDHIDSPVTIFALQLASRTMLRKTKRPDGTPFGIRRRRPWPRFITGRKSYDDMTYIATTLKIETELYSSDVWNSYVAMRFDMWRMSIKSEKESRRRSFSSLTCSTCGKVKSVGVNGFADVRFSNKIEGRECNPCFKTICDLDGDDLVRELVEQKKIMAKMLERGRGWSCHLMLA